MSRKKKTKAEILAEIERNRIEMGQARAEKMRLNRTGATAQIIEVKNSKGHRSFVVMGNRKDAFQVLLERKAISQDGFNAVRRYEEDLAIAAGHLTPERRPDHIRASVEGAPGQNISQAMIEASARVRWVDDRLPGRDMKLLTALRINDPKCWREVVKAVTGEKQDDCHTALIRAMADNLKEAIRTAPKPQRKAA